MTIGESAVQKTMAAAPSDLIEPRYLKPDDDDAMAQLQGHSITYRIAVGPQQGRKVFTLQTLPPDDDSPCGSDRVAKEAGFSLHAGVWTEAHQRDTLERLCRCISRPAVSEKRLALTLNGIFSFG